MSCPRPSENNIVFSIKEVSCKDQFPNPFHFLIINERHTGVGRVQRHWLKSFMLTERRAGPFPNSAHISLTCKFIASSSNRGWMPILESYIGTFEVGKKLLRASTNLRSVRWRCLFDAFVDKMSVQQSVFVYELWCYRC